ncbi:MAG TPA: phosphatase PAP2 family protein [Streptosporangiaceae bacterium]|jgi:tRNA A-37 threonylcarbamoyl transferase component Bud32/membrane-associated phospholipid phosphatase
MNPENEPHAGPDVKTAATERPATTEPLPSRAAPKPVPRHRRPSGQPPPLPHHLEFSGFGWLIAALAGVAASVVVFAGGMRGVAVAVTVVDDAVVRWLGGLDVPGLAAVAHGFADLAAFMLFMPEVWLVVALLALRRFRHLLVFVLCVELGGALIHSVASVAQRPRPFGVDFRYGWGGFALPSIDVAAVTVVLVGVLYTLMPQGRWRNRGKWLATALVAAVALSMIYLGVLAPTDALMGVLIGVAVPLAAFRLFTPDEVFPVTYRRGRTAHLDLGGARGRAIRQALEDQLGLVAIEVKPFGLAGSGGSTPMRIRCKGDPDSYLFGKLYAQSHLRADRWYKLGRELLYGRLEDEKPFNSVRRLVQQEDYALRLMRDAGLPSPEPYGFVELTPEREYLLVTEFFGGATELGDADVDDRVIDDGLRIVRRLWDAGLAHRDIKPANLLVRDDGMVLIDVAFAEVRPTPWRQAVDLANMMLCLGLRSTPQRVYQRALLQFTTEEVTEAFAAARGLALPSQLRRALRAAGRDIHAEFLRLLPAPPRPISVQRWNARRVWLWALVVGVGVILVSTAKGLVVNEEVTKTPLNISSVGCRDLEPLWLEAQSVPSAAMVPCVRTLPPGWTFADISVNNGRTAISLTHDRAGEHALRLTLTRGCNPGAAAAVPSGIEGVQRHQAGGGGRVLSTWYDRFPGGCVTAILRSASPVAAVNAELPRQVAQAIGYTSRDTLRSALDRRSDGRLHLDPGQPR